MLGEWVVERSKGVGARRVGEGGGVRGGQGGWNLYLNEVLNKTGIVTLTLVIGMHITRRNRPKLRFWGVSPVLAGNPHGMTSQSRKNVIISPKKSPRTRCARDFT